MIADRITIDIDHYVPSARLRALRAYYGLQRIDWVEHVTVHISTGGHGLHITGECDTILPDEYRHSTRRDLCDDAKRVALDEVRGEVGHATEIYWTEKEGNEGEREEMPGIWEALDRLEATRADPRSRVKALSQHGRKAVWDTHWLNRASRAEMTGERQEKYADI